MSDFVNWENSEGKGHFNVPDNYPKNPKLANLGSKSENKFSITEGR